MTKPQPDADRVYINDLNWVFYMRTLFLILLLFLSNTVFSKSDFFPDSFLNLNTPVSYEKMTQFLKGLSGTYGPVQTSVEVTGKTPGGKNLYLIHIRKSDNPVWRLFFFAQQHGNEPAGKDALLYLCRELVRKPEILPDNAGLWIIPSVNPDGAEKNQRRNLNDVDLNRDHLLLTQIETQTLHRVYREIKPHLSFDCHEFGRDSRDYSEKGWTEWPQIMMDCSNNLLFNQNLYQAGLRWIGNAEKELLASGINFTRYYVGGPPPDNECRFSTLEADDARNGVGAYGGLSFIIESGNYRNAETPDSDLPDRIAAYMALFHSILKQTKESSTDLQIIRQSRNVTLPDFFPTNYFWGNPDGHILNVRVTEKLTGNTQNILTQSFMTRRIVKKSVPSCQGYAVCSMYAPYFLELFQKHAIEYKILNQEKKFLVQRAKLLRVEEYADPLYSRYAGRQIVEIQDTEMLQLEPGSLIISLDQKYPVRIVNKLEPAYLYGLYQYESYRQLADADSILPVYRLIYD